MTENGALVCVGVGTGEGSKDTIDGKNPAKFPVVMLISPVSTFQVLDKKFLW